LQRDAILKGLEGVRSRFVICLLIMGVGFAGAYSFSGDIVTFIMRPMTRVLPAGETPVYTWLPEAFFCHIKAALGVGFLLALPAILYAIWSCFAPRYGIRGRLPSVVVVGLATVLFVAGAAFCYFLVMPFAFKYLIGLAPEGVQALPRMGEYFGLACWLLFAFGAIFELPLIVSILSRAGVVSPAFLQKKRKYAFLMSFVLAALLTPTPDVFNQLLMAGPLVVLYELGIIGARIFIRKKPCCQISVSEIPG
jgi:sec-independent protein translocase protein TatC